MTKDRGRRDEGGGSGSRPATVRRLATALLVFALGVTAAWSQAVDIVMIVTGETQGPIAGDWQGTAAPDAISLIEFHHLVLEPDPSGNSHKELIVTKEHVDPATVNLWQAYANAELLSVTIQVYDMVSGDLQEETALEGASITSIETLFSATGGDPLTERLHFRYGNLTVRMLHYNPDGTKESEENTSLHGDFRP